MTVQEAVREMVRRIVRRFDPQEIILFGSQARGDADSKSDVDLLIVLPDFGASRRKKCLEILGELHGMGVGKDVIVRTPQELDREKNIAGSIGRSAQKEGRRLYQRPT